jgi:hypothetical protein
LSSEEEAALEEVNVSLDDDEVAEGAGTSRTRPLYPCGRSTFKPCIVRARNVEMPHVKEYSSVGTLDADSVSFEYGE